jgi:serine phosphatase RsbU (regulator of sigma subunit)
VPVPQALQDQHTGEVELRADLVRAQRMLETIYAVTEATANVLEPKKLFNQILDYLFGIFPDADRGFIMLLDPANQLVPAAIRRRKGEGYSGGLVVSQSVVGKVLQEGKSVLSSGSKKSAGGARMCAPLAAGGKTLGILLIEGRAGAQSFSQEDLDLLSGVAMQAGVAILNAHLHQLLLRQQRLEQDMLFAKQVQRSFMPSEPPELPGYLFARRYNPVFDVGGDFYDFIPLPEQRIGILIGDVSGKGVSAALLMARLTSDMRYFSISEVSPARVLARANASLIGTAQDNMFATVLYMVLDAKSHRLTLSNAGHIPPLLRQGRNGTVAEVDEATNLALGVLPDAVFDEFTLDLAPQDCLVLCTDGVVEAKSPIQEEYGFQRLQRAIAATPPGDALEGVLKDLVRHTGSTSQYDDITMVAFTRTA